MIADLLEWSGRQMDAFYASMICSMSATSAGPVTGRCLSGSTSRKTSPSGGSTRCRCEAIDRVEGHAERYLPAVLRTFVWALPRQYRVDALPEPRSKST